MFGMDRKKLYIWDPPAKRISVCCPWAMIGKLGLVMAFGKFIREEDVLNIFLEISTELMIMSRGHAGN
jgi:hypothetical protein